MAKALAIPFDGSKQLQNNMHERYARIRANAVPRLTAYRKAGNVAKNDNVANANSFRLEKKPGVRERIEFLTRQAQDRIAEKRVALEEQLWAVLEADIGAFWETYEAAKTGNDGKLSTDQHGKMLTVRKQRAKLINDLPPEFRKLIEDVTVDRNGNVIPKLYSKAQANRGLREMLNIGGRIEGSLGNRRCAAVGRGTRCPTSRSGEATGREHQLELLYSPAAKARRTKRRGTG
jgi:hypothetical protein